MTRILLADDHELMREGLRTLLAAQPDVEIVGEAEDGVTAVRRALELRPDIVIMDVGMPQMNGIEATRRLATELPGTKIIALSMHSDRRYVAEMLKAGAAGYVLKQGAFRELASAIAAVKASHIYLSPRVAGVGGRAGADGGLDPSALPAGDCRGRVCAGGGLGPDPAWLVQIYQACLWRGPAGFSPRAAPPSFRAPGLVRVAGRDPVLYLVYLVCGGRVERLEDSLTRPPGRL